MMYILAILCTLLVTTSAEFCYNNVNHACHNDPAADSMLLPNCHAKFGGFEGLLPELQSFANTHIEMSFEYLLLSTHFGNYENNREGFQKLYRKLSDDAWEDAINVIKYIAKRGGKMNFRQSSHIKKNPNAKTFQVPELYSLAKALDSEKLLAEETMRIHAQAQLPEKKDAAVAHYVQEKFFEKQAECIRNLAGYTSDLQALLTEHHVSPRSVGIYLFDEYLQKIL